MTKMETTKDTKNPLPAGWRWVRLGEVLSVLESGSRPKGGAVGVESGVRSISAEQMTTNGNLDFAIKRYVPRDFYEQMTRGHLQQGDILIVKDGATTGKTCFVDETFPFREAVVNEHVFICRANQDRVQSLFLFYWLWGPQGQYEIRSSFQGAAIGGINQGFVDSVFIPLPPLAEQRRIAGVLREQMAAVDKARAAAQARLAAVKALPAAFLLQVFPQPGQPLPAGWRSSMLGDLCEGPGQYGTSKKSNSDGKGTPVLGMYHIHDGRIRWENISHIELPRDELSKYLLRCGDLLFNRTNSAELVGKTAVYDQDVEAVFASYLIRFRLTKYTADPHFVCVYINSRNGRVFIERNMGRAIGQVNISASTMHKIPIPIPDFAEQRRIAGVLREQMAAVEKARAAAEEELNTIHALPAALLRRAFNGEI